MLTAPPKHLLLGQLGEDHAAAYLRSNGLHIIERNWRYRGGELDIVAQDRETIVFVEVKTRTTERHGLTAQAVTLAKQVKLAKAAQIWLDLHQSWQTPCRFDIICLVGKNPNFRVEHYRDAFDFPHTMGHRNTYWQPW